MPWPHLKLTAFFSAARVRQIGALKSGVYLLEAPDLDTVVDLCRVLPAYDIDIRPVLDAP